MTDPEPPTPEWDFSADQFGQAQAGAPPEVPHVDRPSTGEVHNVQRTLAYMAFTLLSGVVIGLGWFLHRGDLQSADSREIALAVFSSVSSLTATVFGFYFGQGQR